MTSDKGILIKNIYYMLTYAFQSLRQSNFDKVAAEEFENIHDMFAAILGKGVASQLKQGLYREYILQEEELSVLRGKLNIQGTIRNIIEDQGIGISEKDLPLIFERFYRTDRSRNRKTGGAGIGLTIAKAIIQAHGGKIKVESKEGYGSKFIITLPKR